MNAQKIGNYRWTIVSLLFFATTINYMDRQVIGYLKPLFSSPIEKGGLGWSNTDFGNVTSLFTFFYAGITFIAGFIIDKIGTKLGLALSLIIWSVFGILNAFAGSMVIVHAFIRSLFGIGEAGNFPASIKTIAEWFPKKERALATGIFNSGANVGAMIASIVVPLIAYHVWFNGAIAGWQMAYIITGLIGFFWLIFWFWLYETPKSHKKLSAAEFDYIHSDDTEPAKAENVLKAPWYKVLKYRQTWAFFTGKFLTDGIWWFLLFWLPDFMKQQFNMEGHAIMVPLFTVYALAILGSVLGGGFPMLFMNKGMEAYKARLTAMLIIAILPVSLLTTPYFGNVSIFGGQAYIYALIVICIAAAAHQAWSCNIFTTVSDMFPKKAVGSVTGIGGLAGGLGGVLIQQIAGRLTDHYKKIGEAAAVVQNLTGDTARMLVQSHVQTAYGIMFSLCALSYLIAWVCIKILVPKFQPITDL